MSGLLAGVSSLQGFGFRFRGDFRFTDMLGALLLLALLGLGYWALAQSERWKSAKARRHSPKRLFHELAVAHRLSPLQRKACREVAAELGLEEAAMLFVRPDARAALARHDAALADRLYGEETAPV